MDTERPKDEGGNPEQTGEPLPLVMNSKNETNRRQNRKKVSKAICIIWNWIKGFDRLAIATLLLFIATFGLYRATSTLVIDAENTAERQLRAYVAVPAPQEVHAFAGGWRYFPGFENRGVTPTQWLTAKVSYCLTDKRIANFETFDFPDFSDPPAIHDTMVRDAGIAPPYEIVSNDDLAAISKEKRFFYMWGWIKYWDVFSKNRSLDEQRVTLYCWQAAAAEGNPATDKFHMRFNGCGRGNHTCVDAECRDEERRTQVLHSTPQELGCTSAPK
jgi:hypothetical protein